MATSDMAEQAAAEPIALAPVSARARIDVLDILRGVAILGIFYMNIPFMGGTVMAEMTDMRLQGWMPADRWTWSILQVALEGTQRGMLEMLFGAGMMILSAKAMAPTGPVAVADLYMRRTLWLLVFGLVDSVLLLWPGDILHTYALAALFLFPFRKLGPKLLVGLGLVYAVLGGIGVGGGGAIVYVQRIAVVHQIEAAHQPLTKPEKDALATWQKKLDLYKLTPKQKKEMAEEVQARHGSFWHYATWLAGQWWTFVSEGEMFNVCEAFSTMLIGVALYKRGFIQGLRTRRFYLATMLIAYAFGMGARALGVEERLSFQPIPKTFWFTFEFSRLAVSLGHVALVNLLVQTAGGMAILRPFRVAGRMAFSLYVLETIIGMWILFPAFGFGLWNHFGWFGLAAIATTVGFALLIVANLWVIWFATGPLEWAWRSLAYCKRQPFLRQRVDEPIVVGP